MNLRAVFFALALASGLSGATAGFATEAVNYHINPQHSGAAQFEPALKLPLKMAWSRTFSGNVGYPLIAGSAIFVNVAGAGYSSVIQALNPTTGATIWSAKIDTTYNSAGIAYDAGMLFVVNHSGVVTAFNASNGQKIWQQQMPTQWSFDSAPTARNGVLYVLGAGSGSTLCAVREATGALLWSSSLFAGDTSSPTLSEDGVFVSFPCQAYEFDAISGAQRWFANNGCSGGGGVTTALYDQLLFTSRIDFNYSSSGYALLAYNGKKQAGLGNLANSNAYVAHIGYSFPPALQAGRGFFVNNLGALVARSIPSMTQIWSFNAGGGMLLAPIVVDGTVLALTTNGSLYALEAATGTVKRTEALTKATAGDITLASGLAAGNQLIAVPLTKSLTVFTGS